MRHTHWPWLLAWAGISLAAALILVRLDIATRRELIQSHARAAHGVLSQHAAQHDAILASLSLLDAERRAGQRLPSVYPQVLEVLRRDEGEAWPDAKLLQTETLSRAQGRPAAGVFDAATKQYAVVLAGQPSSFALRIDVSRLLVLTDWPLARDTAARATLALGGHPIELQAGAPANYQPSGLTDGFVFDKVLASASQSFTLRVTRAAGPAEWPWRWLLLASVCIALALAGMKSWLDGRRARRRAEELLRVGQTARLNTFGELAGGIAHELNQPLAAIITNAQAAQRLMDDDPPQQESARQAMAQAAAQGRRAADVVARLRRLVERPDAAKTRQAVDLESALNNVLQLLEPEWRLRGIRITMNTMPANLWTDPVALEQIMHNLLRNAIQALEVVPQDERRLALTINIDGQQAVLTVCDHGPGMSDEVLARAFEPFFTTRGGGLGLGLSLCASLTESLQGTLSAHHARPRGAEFRLKLPLAQERP